MDQMHPEVSKTISVADFLSILAIRYTDDITIIISIINHSELAT